MLGQAKSLRLRDNVCSVCGERNPLAFLKKLSIREVNAVSEIIVCFARGGTAAHTPRIRGGTFYITRTAFYGTLDCLTLGMEQAFMGGRSPKCLSRNRSADSSSWVVSMSTPRCRNKRGESVAEAMKPIPLCNSDLLQSRPNGTL